MPDVGNFWQDAGRTGRGEMNDQRLADAIDVGVTHAHEMIEDVTEHRSADLLEDDS